MVNLIRVERKTEQTGSETCPLVGSQIPRTSRLLEATRVIVNHALRQPNTPVIEIDKRWKPVKRTLYVQRLG